MTLNYIILLYFFSYVINLLQKFQADICKCSIYLSSAAVAVSHLKLTITCQYFTQLCFSHLEYLFFFFYIGAACSWWISPEFHVRFRVWIAAFVDENTCFHNMVFLFAQFGKKDVRKECDVPMFQFCINLLFCIVAVLQW